MRIGRRSENQTGTVTGGLDRLRGVDCWPSGNRLGAVNFRRLPESSCLTDQQQQLLADIQNTGHQPGGSQRVAKGASFVVQGTGFHGNERKGFVERADLLHRPLRTRTVGGVGAGS